MTFIDVDLAMSAVVTLEAVTLVPVDHIRTRFSPFTWTTGALVDVDLAIASRVTCEAVA